MPKIIRKFCAFFVVILVFANLIQIKTVKADIDECSASIIPNQVDSGSTNNFTLTINNTSANDIIWIRITRPSSNFTLSNINASGWTKGLSASVITLTNGSLSSGSQRNFILTNVAAASVDAASTNWTIEVSDNSGGSNPFSCSGTLGTQIGNVDSTPPIVTNITVSDITTTSALVSWTTDELADSKVNFGLTGSYGSNQTDASFVTSHSINLTGLDPATGYHYQIVSADPSSNSTSSSDNTFLTLTPPTSGSTPSETNSTPTIGQVTQNKNSSDKTLPVVTLTTDFSKVYTDAPEILGTATDNIAVSSVEFSIDSGLNWLAVDSSTNLGSKQVSFKFKPTNLSDDNYSILVRAIDSSGNVGLSSAKTLIIDKIAPVIGPSLISIGPQVVRPNGNTIHAVKNIDQKITFSAIGGPTSVTIFAQTKDKKEIKIFTLSKIVGSGLWSGILAFDKEGTYELQVQAVDGANNKFARNLDSVLVEKPSVVVIKDKVTSVAGAKITLYYFDDETSSWVLWDGAAFGEKNPQTTNQTGEFNFYIPEGKYYLTAQKEGFKELTSEIFVLNKSTNLATTLPLERSFSLKLGNFNFTLPSFSLNNFKIQFNQAQESKDEANSLVGKDLPHFSFPDTTGQNFDSLSLLGKESVISFIVTWDPSAEEQIYQLETLQKDQDFNLVKISLLESSLKLAAYTKIAGYSGNFLADSLGESLTKFNVQSLPLHVFVSRAGIIKQIATGVLTANQLRYNLEN